MEIPGPIFAMPIVFVPSFLAKYGEWFVNDDRLHMTSETYEDYIRLASLSEDYGDEILNNYLRSF